MTIDETIKHLVAEAVRAELAAGFARFRADMMACWQTAAQTRKRLTLTEARNLLPGGCRQARLLEALANGALRGEQQGGRRTWIVEAEDVLRWDAAGRPTSPKG